MNMKKILMFAITFTFLFSSCKKDSSESENQPGQSFDVGQLYANGIINRVEIIKDEFQNTSKPNYWIQVVSLKEYDDLTYQEAFDKIKTLKDEFGEWTFSVLYYESLPGVRLDGFLAKNNGTVFSKNKNFWINTGLTGKTSEVGYWYLRNDGAYNGSSTQNKTLKYSIRPTRIATYYNSPIKSLKVGNRYNYSSFVFSVDAVNKKLKIYTRVGNSSSKYDLQKQWMNEVVYDKEYGFRLPTVEEMKEIQKVEPTFNFNGVWTSDLDTQNGNKPFVYRTNANPQVSSSITLGEGSQTVGVKEISF